MAVRAFLVVLCAFLVLSSSTFAMGISNEGTVEAATFDEVITIGLTQATVQEAQGAGAEIPQTVVYYSQYRNAIGYYGTESFLNDVKREGHERQFGQPLVVYVSDFSGVQPRLIDQDYLSICPGCSPEMIRAENAYFVVESQARTPAGPTIVSFSQKNDAEDFVDEYGGQILQWEELRQRSVDADRISHSEWQDIVRQHHTEANETVAATQPLLDRPVSVVVGEDAPTLQAAIEEAPPNSTIQLPPGTYNATDITVDKPVTIVGSGNATELRGHGNETVIRFSADRSAIASLRITMTGDRQPTNVSKPSNWTTQVKTAHTLADPAIQFTTAEESLVANVSLQPAANGIVFIGSDQSVVHNTTIIGDHPWDTGYTSVLAFRSQLVIQESTFLDGRDALYTHYASGLVARNNYMESMRFGVHNMYSSEVAVSNNTIRDTHTGVSSMTRLTRNAIVGNDIRNSSIGIADAGSENYIAQNTLTDNEQGMRVQGSQSLYTRNILAHNQEGIHVGRVVEDAEHYGTIVPTTRVTENDFIDNDRHVTSEQLGPLQVWTHQKRGNYWSGAPGFDRNGDGVIDREFRVTGTVDNIAYRERGGKTLALSPAVMILRSLQSVVPGLQASGVIDSAPLATSVRANQQQLNSHNTSWAQERRENIDQEAMEETKHDSSTLQAGYDTRYRTTETTSWKFGA